MSILKEIQSAIVGAGIPVGEGKYPETAETCGKIVFIGEEDSISFLGGRAQTTENFKIVVRGNDSRVAEQTIDVVRLLLKNAGFVQVGGYQNEETDQNDAFIQLSVKFKSLK